MSPGMGYLGSNFHEAADLQSQHEEVISGIKSKQVPVEDLLRQADELIVNKVKNDDN